MRHAKDASGKRVMDAVDLTYLEGEFLETIQVRYWYTTALLYHDTTKLLTIRLRCDFEGEFLETIQVGLDVSPRHPGGP